MADNRIDDVGEFDTDLSEVAAAIAALDADDLEMIAPPDDVWAGIEVQIADEPAPRAIKAVSTMPTVTSISERRQFSTERTARRRLPGRSTLLAAAAVLVIAVAAGAFVVARGDDATTIASADLAFDVVYDPLGADAVASVTLLDDGDAFGIEFEQAALPNSELEDEDLELWLIQADDNGNVVDLVSLGIVDDIGRRYAVPDGYDPDAYSIVDISVEPRDGEPQHSGRTILRGQLNA